MSGTGQALVPDDRPQESSVGVVEYFHLGDYERVERVVGELEQLGVGRLRTAVSWADWVTEAGPAWYEWLLPKLARSFELLPCLVYTPPSLGMVASTSSPPLWPPCYSEFVVDFLLRYEQLIEQVELWNEPNCVTEWDWRLDPDWSIFCETIAPAARIARKRGLRVVLGGMSPVDENWLALMCERGVVDAVDVVGIHGFPGTWEAGWDGWERIVGRVRSVLDRHHSDAAVWITETGYSTWRDENAQEQALLDALAAPAEAVYWYAAEDLNPARRTLEGFHTDERSYHFGLWRADGTAKALARTWAQSGLGTNCRPSESAVAPSTSR